MAVQTGKRIIDVLNPVTEALIGQVVDSTPADVAEAVAQARAAQHIWAARPVRDRAQVLRKFGDLLWKHRDEIMATIQEETGKNQTGALVELLGIDGTVTYYAQHGPAMLRPEPRPTYFPFIQRGKVYHKPHGVVGFITPWNYPAYLVIGDVAPALLAGNSVVIKPSEDTPYSALALVNLLHAAGVPPEAAQVVTGRAEAGKTLIDEVDYISFTGSTATGRVVGQQAAERLIPYSLELGGKDAMIVLADADVELAASGAILAAYENAGQMCTSIERVYVEAPIYNQFVERLRVNIAMMQPGIHMGSMTRQSEVERVESQIEDALERGAELIAGGKRRPEFGPLFFEPTMLVNVDHSMRVMTEETFGPVIPVMKVGSATEAIRLANDSEYGLTATIYTADLDRGERLATQLNVGAISINRPVAALIASPHLPWGGQKQSGFGRRAGPEGLLRFTAPQSVLVDTLIGSQPALTLLDPVTLVAARVLRVLRRYLPLP